ncbi:MAG: glycerol-3-phosphate 1-O-acyltransferase PlsY [Mailhella sp.]|nr:glycerol-3-phosphate 1-O-acyltransferase PlsY [Mailhella sp.]
MTYLILALCLAFAFILGSIPFGLVIAKTFKGIDPRKAGSGNIGSTNVARLCGMPCGLLTLFCDIMKGTLPVLIAVHVLPSMFMQSLVAFAAVMGHIKSPFLGFKGGKGVATTIGALIPLAFLPLLCAVACFFVVVFITRYVSLSSMTMSVALVVFYAVFGYWELMPLGVVLAAMIIWAHRSNIGRLMRGEESKFSLKKKK